MNIGVIGCGAYSLALSIALNKVKDNKITVWSESHKKIEEINKKHMLNEALPGITLPSQLNYTTSLDEATLNKDVIFVVVSINFLESTLSKLKNNINNNTVICLATKGIDPDTNLFPHEIMNKIKTIKHLVCLSGPSFAIDIASNDPVGLSLASKSKKALETIRNCFTKDRIKLRFTNDLIGVELCGSIKNVIAIASGIIKGLGYNESAQAFLITESLHDIKKLIKHLGGDEKSILSFAGIGDILLTATSQKSRNFSLGLLIGKNSNKQEINNFLCENTTEGYYTLKSLGNIMKKRNINLELINVIYDIVVNHENPQILIDFLITKE